MAVLEIAGHIHGDTLSCIQYIQNPEKTVYGNDTAKVIRYMQSHCIEDVMSVGYNGTSGDRELAVEQFRLAESSYKACHPARAKQTTRITVEQYLESNHKRKLPKHIKPDADGMITITKEEVSAEHLVLSVHKTDRVTPAKLQSVVSEFMAHPYFQHFPALSNLHWNTDEAHAHILISNYAKDGRRKLSLTGTKLRELQRHLDKICYRHGLSIIDSKAARLDPDHAAWIDRVKSEGRVKVWPAKNRNQTNWKAADNRAKAERVERILAQSDVSEAREKQIEYIVKNDLFVGYSGQYLQIKMLCPTWYLERKRRAALYEEELKRREKWLSFYHVKRIGRSEMTLCFELYDARIKGEYAYIKARCGDVEETLKIRVDKTLQTLMDSIAICRQFNVRLPEELEQRRAELGAEIGKTKKAIAYDHAVLAQNEPVSVSEGSEGNSASELVKRSERRLEANEAYLKELNKSYRDMSHGIAVLKESEYISLELARRGRAELEAVPVEPKRPTPSLADMIADAATRSKPTQKRTDAERGR